MPRHDPAALRRLARYGYVPTKDRMDSCRGCEHSSPYQRGREGVLKCKRVGTCVSAGAKCNDWKAKKPAAVCAPGSESDRLKSISRPVENDCEDQGMSNVSDGCNKWPCVKEPLTKTGNGWKCTKCGGSY